MTVLKCKEIYAHILNRRESPENLVKTREEVLKHSQELHTVYSTTDVLQIVATVMFYCKGSRHGSPVPVFCRHSTDFKKKKFPARHGRTLGHTANHLFRRR